MLHKITTVEPEKVRHLLHQIYYKRKRQTLRLNDLLSVHRRQILQLLKGLLLLIVQEEVLLDSLPPLALNVRHPIGQQSLPDINPLLLFAQTHQHNIGYLQHILIRQQFTANPNIKILQIQIVHILLRIRLKKRSLVNQTKSQSLKTLIKQFHVLLVNPLLEQTSVL